MATEVHMPGPMCLIENVKGQLRANQEALGILEDITQPVVVVAIVGLYRTGKSYLMNKLAGKQTGFSLGSTVQSHTKGIWMWCVPHPQKPGHTLVLLDTEGLGDVEKGDNQNDCWIFALAILLSSTFVYNSMGPINQPAIDQLHYVTELTDRIRSRSSRDQDEVEDSDEFVRFFPDFVWALRDFSLELKLNGEPISADEYLENSLKLKQGIGQRDKVKELNLPQLCIHKFFPKKKCFVFERPVHGKKVAQIESLQDQDLDSDFVEQVAEFCSYVFSCSKVKTLSGGIKVNGARLKSLVVTHVNTICSGSLPCIENAVLALSQTENAAAVQKAIAHYDQQMSQKLQLPTETLQELMNLHRASEKEAIKIFMDNSFKDVNQVFMTQLVTELETKQEEFLKKNEQASSDRCLALLQDIFSPLEDDVKQGIYHKPGGYHLFIQKTQELKKKYYEEPRKGVQAEEVLQRFLQSKDDVTDAILQTDQELTEKQKEIEVEHMKAEAEEATAKIREEMQQKIEKLLKQKEKSHKKHMKQLTEMMEKGQGRMREMQQRNEQLLQEKEKCHEEHMKQLTEKMEKAQYRMSKMEEKIEQLLQQTKSYEELRKQLTEKTEEARVQMREMQEKFEKLLQQKDNNHAKLMKELTENLLNAQKVYKKVCQIREQLQQEKIKLQEQVRHLEKSQCVIS
ncbi:guanylate-binding protein 1 isoform X2 [Cricetulus griseus]|uniref:Guanylate-binding protein 1 isoform X2 n=1 Tax=Cricetulus griseus TaxID=10029 RepID=A0A9J7F9Q4_CRIGR|nr:guanylate-binding protein 1 isoform X2 [Cricetulus griseus]